MKVRYSHNNSGGRWWLSDRDWFNLEKAGWTIEWYKDRKDGFGVDKEDRFLGALASAANKEFNSIEDAIAEWESITGKDHTEEGCPCCGEPHYFYDTKY